MCSNLEKQHIKEYISSSSGGSRSGSSSRRRRRRSSTIVLVKLLMKNLHDIIYETYMKHELMNENVYMKNENLHTKTCVFTAPDAHMRTMHNSLKYTCIFKHITSRLGSKISDRFI